MANSSQFQLFITCVDSVGPLLKLWGQSDQTSMVFVERFLLQLTPDFEKGHYVPNIANLKVGQLCVGKYNDGVYYRAKILDLSQIRDGCILVHFIDHGNTESLPLTSIRVVDGSSPLTSFVPLANEYILAGIINASQTWEGSTFEMLTNMVCNMELNVIAIATVGPYKIINIQFNNEDLSKMLINYNVAIPCSISTQTQILVQKLNQVNQTTTDPQVNRVPRDKPYPIPRRTNSVPTGGNLIEETPRLESPAVFKNTILPIHSEHLVTVSAVEDGPKSFTLQIQSWEKYLNKLMTDLNTLFTVSLSEIPVPGTLCIAVNSLNRSLCRAVITQVIEDNCKVYFVDFGNSEVISYSELYQLPPAFISHKILALRFSLSNLKSINITSEIKSSFKDFVIGKTLKLRVMPPEGPPVLQYGELFDEKGVNVLTILKTTLGLEILKFRPMARQETDCIADVSVAYIKTCQEFYVHFLSDIDALLRLMSDLGTHCLQNQNYLQRNRVQIGMACCALFPDDGQWYRAEVLGCSGNDIHVKYVDYGNEGFVSIDQVKEITIELVNRLPIQALRCCLVGYENEPVDQQLSTAFESIALENNYTMKIIKYHTPHVLLVNLIDMNTRVLISNTLLEAQKQTQQEVIPQTPTYTTPPSSNTGAGDNNYLDGKRKSRNRNEETPPRFRKKENGKSVNERLQRRTSPNVPTRGDESEKGRFRNMTSPNNNDRLSRNDWSKKNDKSSLAKPSWNDSKREKSFSNDSKKENSWNNAKKDDDSRWNDSRKSNSSWNDSKKDSRNDFKRTSPSWNESKKDNWNESRKGNYNETKKDNWNESKKDNWNDSKKENVSKRDSRRDNRREYKKDSSFSKSDSDSNSERRFDRTNKPFKNSKFEGRKRTDSRSSDKSDTSFRKKRFEKPKSSNIPYTAPPADYANLNDKFTELNYPEGAIENVMISWFYNPKHFYIQITSMESQFRKMMTDIQKIYKSRSPVQDAVPAGSSVIAHFSEDNLLYRATILDFRLDKYKVRYVDYGNTNFVDKNKIFQVEKQFMELPVQSVVCTLQDIYPAGETWNDSPEMDNCFNKGNYQCVFHAEFNENKRVVSLSYNGLLVTDDLINRGLATSSASAPQTNEQLNDSNISQQIPEDAPVDLGLLQEQTLRITISCAYGLERFYVYLDKIKAENVLKLINDYANEHSTTFEKLSTEQIVNGTVCLTQTETGWQRCIISNAAATKGIFVEFPDVGGGEEISAEKLFTLPVELTGYYYQSVECGLNNFDLGCLQHVNDEEFQSKYEKSELIAYINEVQNGRLLVTLYDCDGNKLVLIKDDETEDDFSTVSPLCPMAVLNGNMKVWITHINTYDSFYIQRVADNDKVTELLNTLYKHYENNERTRSDITINQLCAVKSQDGNWYRGRVLEINDASITVIYIDYGNQETVDINNVQNLDPSFYTINEYALHVALPISAENDISEQLKELTNGKEFYSKLAYTEGCWYIELYSENIGLSSYLIESGIANKLDFDPFRRRFEATTDDKTDDKIMLYVAHADTPNQFYAQLANDENSINALQEELEKSISTLSDLEAPDAGVLCAAKYSADDVWYRAEVLDADDQITTVRFIDYGNTDVLDNSSGVIKTLPSHMLTIDRYAKKCSLDVTPIGEEWSQTACEMFEQKLVGQICQASVLYQDKGVMYVSIYFNDENIAESLIHEGYAKLFNRDIQDELSNKTGFVSHINSINEFWIQLESSCADLEMVSDQLSIADQFPELNDKRPGVLCAARFPDDNDWYRARILSSTDDENVTQVLFIDYGNSSITTELKMLPEQVINIRALALKCSLLKPSYIEEWPSDVTDQFRELAADGATIFDVKVVTTGETSIVELSIEDKNIIEILLPKSKTTVTAAISHVISPESFWIQLSDNSHTLSDICHQLEDVDALTKIDNPVENTIYIAQSPEDQLWYRAKIESGKTDEGYEVFFIDYGNKSITQEIRECHPDLAIIEPLAKHCTLKNFVENSTWNQEAGSTLNELSDYGNTTFDVKFLNEDDDPALVSLYWEGKDVSLAINYVECSDEVQEKTEDNKEETQPHTTCRKIIDAISSATNLNKQNLHQFVSKDGKENETKATNEEKIENDYLETESKIQETNDNQNLDQTENISTKDSVEINQPQLENGNEIISPEDSVTKDYEENIQNELDSNKMEEKSNENEVIPEDTLTKDSVESVEIQLDSNKVEEVVSPEEILSKESVESIQSQLDTIKIEEIGNEIKVASSDENLDSVEGIQSQLDKITIEEKSQLDSNKIEGESNENEDISTEEILTKESVENSQSQDSNKIEEKSLSKNNIVTENAQSEISSNTNVETSNNKKPKDENLLEIKNISTENNSSDQSQLEIDVSKNIDNKAVTETDKNLDEKNNKYIEANTENGDKEKIMDNEKSETSLADELQLCNKTNSNTGLSTHENSKDTNNLDEIQDDTIENVSH
ncbi:maternal protein tudor-like isoform X2 [Chrysoperla carnea]|uniref:maternal protein tudor-like isoform X2 n=1 Tax=Chrysoperla carnea TaxID=189513 RepID=UPI001D05C650|nr:maternal protein tudor-like isoform X2 [Chrysoperla carnea]